ncbi:hypothetical protein SH139x_002278 [Planctomycetaceae bacterium SH139]
MTKIYAAIGFACLTCFSARAVAQPPQVPRIDSVVMADNQPHQDDPAVIWYDDFDLPQRQEQYPEKSGKLSQEVRFGNTGTSLEMAYPRGSQGIGGRKVFFGDSPTNRRQTLRGDESFDDIYWRIYVKHPADWKGGGPAKLSRATSLVPPGWRQAMIAHVWSSGEALTLDPASGVKNGSVVTTGYNDFPNLKWLGNKPTSQFKLHGDDGLGWWVCVEARAKLNTPGKNDGVNQLWIDGRLEAERRNLDWRGTFDERGINAIFLEAYWNEGSPVDQARWIDNFVISTKPIGPVVCSTNPTILKTSYIGPGYQHSWQAEIAERDSMGAAVGNPVWRSLMQADSNQVTINLENGEFLGRLSQSSSLANDTSYLIRVRQRSSNGQWSLWSDWHQPFQTKTANEESSE